MSNKPSIERDEQGTWSVLDEEFDHMKDEAPYKSTRKTRQLITKKFLDKQLPELLEELALRNQAIKERVELIKKMHEEVGKTIESKSYQKFKELWVKGKYKNFAGLVVKEDKLLKEIYDLGILKQQEKATVVWKQHLEEIRDNHLN